MGGADPGWGCGCELVALESWWLMAVRMLEGEIVPTKKDAHKAFFPLCGLGRGGHRWCGVKVRLSMCGREGRVSGWESLPRAAGGAVEGET